MHSKFLSTLIKKNFGRHMKTFEHFNYSLAKFCERHKNSSFRVGRFITQIIMQLDNHSVIITSHRDI